MTTRTYLRLELAGHTVLGMGPVKTFVYVDRSVLPLHQLRTPFNRTLYFDVSAFRKV